MKLVRFGPKGGEKPGLLDEEGKRRDCSAYIRDYGSDFFSGGGLARLTELAGRDDLPVVDDDARWGACVARPGKIVCIGLNYHDHAREGGFEAPGEPLVFLKAPNTTVGPYDDIHLPRQSTKVDWEVELGVVIGKTARYLDNDDEALASIAGYCISHDVSERGFQLERGGQWCKGKCCDTFNPLGPYLVTPDELSVDQLGMNLSVNGEVMQHGSTSQMIFSVAFIIRYLSQFMTLEPGDLISTGTPAGVGFGMKPQRYLKAGDVVELAIEGLGQQRQTCRCAD